MGEPAPISLEEINAIAELAVRVDRKYIVTPEQVAALVADAPRDVRMLEIDGRRAFDYESVYFDTVDFSLYLDTARRRRQRYKVRSRVYVNSGVAMLEVKTKGGRGTTIKQRIEYDIDDAGRLTDEAKDFVVAAVGREGAADHLRPTLTTRYQRSTYVDPESGARLTSDAGLSCTDWRGEAVVLDQVVLETKSPGRPSWFDRWLWADGVRPLKLSKFCTGLAALHPELPANKWHRTLQQHFDRSA